MKYPSMVDKQDKFTIILLDDELLDKMSNFNIDCEVDLNNKPG